MLAWFVYPSADISRVMHARGASERSFAGTNLGSVRVSYTKSNLYSFIHTDV